MRYSYLSIISNDILGTNLDVFCITNLQKIKGKMKLLHKNELFLIKLTSLSHHRNAILIGVVRHDVNISAGKSGFIGNI